MSTEEIIEIQEMATLDYRDLTEGSVKKYIASVEKYLALKFGEKKKIWMATVMMLADSLNGYIECRADIAKNGRIYRSGGLRKKNPAVEMQFDYMKRIEKAVEELGLSPKQDTKVKPERVEDTQTELKLLMGGPDEKDMWSA